MTYHFGKQIRKSLDERGMTVAEFARRIKMSRENAYDIFKRQDLDTHLLRTISTVLDRNFLAESLGSRVQNIPQRNTPTGSLKRLELQIQDLTKRIAMLEKHLQK